MILHFISYFFNSKLKLLLTSNLLLSLLAAAMHYLIFLLQQVFFVNDLFQLANILYVLVQHDNLLLFFTSWYSRYFWLVYIYFRFNISLCFFLANLIHSFSTFLYFVQNNFLSPSHFKYNLLIYYHGIHVILIYFS